MCSSFLWAMKTTSADPCQSNYIYLRYALSIYEYTSDHPFGFCEKFKFFLPVLFAPHHTVHVPQHKASVLTFKQVRSSNIDLLNPYICPLVWGLNHPLPRVLIRIQNFRKTWAELRLHRCIIYKDSQKPEHTAKRGEGRGQGETSAPNSIQGQQKASNKARKKHI